MAGRPRRPRRPRRAVLQSGRAADDVRRIGDRDHEAAQIGFDEVRGGGERSEISTVWFGLDMGLSAVFGGPPITFESMVFGGPLDGTIHRYATRAEARAGHAGLVAEVRAAHAALEREQREQGDA